MKRNGTAYSSKIIIIINMHNEHRFSIVFCLEWPNIGHYQLYMYMRVCCEGATILLNVSSGGAHSPHHIFIYLLLYTKTSENRSTFIE